jgi:hypothetical protein
MQISFLKNYRNHLLLGATLAMFIPPLSMLIHSGNNQIEKVQENFLEVSESCYDFLKNTTINYTFIMFFIFILIKYTDCLSRIWIFVVCTITILYGLLVYNRVKTINNNVAIFILIWVIIWTLAVLGVTFWYGKLKAKTQG